MNWKGEDQYVVTLHSKQAVGKSDNFVTPLAKTLNLEGQWEASMDSCNFILKDGVTSVSEKPKDYCVFVRSQLVRCLPKYRIEDSPQPLLSGKSISSTDLKRILTVDQLINQICKEFKTMLPKSSEKPDVYFQFNQEEGRFLLHEEVDVGVSEELAAILGCDEVWIKHGHPIDEEARAQPVKLNCSDGAPLQSIRVICDALQNQPVGQSLLPVLETLSAPNCKSRFVRYGSKDGRSYKRVCNNQLDSIKVSLLGCEGQQIVHPDSDTTVVIELRRRKRRFQPF